VSWRNPKPTASGLITRREGGSIDVLLVRRAKEPYLGHWDCPGGFIDPDEHPEDAVRRELLEELGLRVDVTRFVGIFMDRYGEEDGESTLNVYYEVAIRGGVIAPASDVSEAAWFPLDRLPEPIAFENSRQALRALQAAG
jgi:8-oxo-dGTP diphosphatase